ncbi:uncharacterized protein LOC117243286 isoform X2 [Bombus vosnesenskii]|uniref:Uncharacterized protein LOC117243286 isoform X2 n=1 Tax=Bombus vosnesenskii TaxID=207650 RepID=A0A6J3LMY4_9HYME|nr:uncharacterized protein LOC117243286 isoform X2 [Bombus vosnesenskii]
MCLDTRNFVNPTIAGIVGDTFLFYLCTIDRESQIADRIELADKKGLVCTGRWLIGWYRLVMIGWSAVNDKRVETFQTMAYIIYEENCNTGAGLPLFRDTPDALRSLRWSSLQWW